MLAFSDSFDRSALGANWSSYTGWSGGVVINSNRVRGEVLDGATGEAISYYSGVILGADQDVSLNLTTFPAYSAGTVQVGPVARAFASPTKTFYVAQALNRTAGLRTRIVRYLNDVSAVIASESSTTWASGNRMRMTVIGSLITVYQNDTPVLSVTDTQIPAGPYAGIELYMSSPGTLADCEVDEFYATSPGIASPYEVAVPITPRAFSTGLF